MTVLFTERTKPNKMAALFLIVFYMYKNFMSLTDGGIPAAMPTGFQDFRMVFDQ